MGYYSIVVWLGLKPLEIQGGDSVSAHRVDDIPVSFSFIIFCFYVINF